MPTDPGSADDALSRLGEARDLASKEANYFFIFAVGFALLYVAKVAGYHLDEIVVGRDVTNIRSGAFIYLVASQFSIMLCMIRTSDSAAFESSIRNLLKTQMQESGRTIQEIYPNSREWFAALTSKISSVPKGGFWLSIFNFTSFLSAALALAIYILPALAGFYYIGDPRNLYFTTSPDVELTVVVITTLLCSLWIVNVIGVVMLLQRLEQTQEPSDGDNLSGRGSGRS